MRLVSSVASLLLLLVSVPVSAQPPTPEEFSLERCKAQFAPTVAKMTNSTEQERAENWQERSLPLGTSDAATPVGTEVALIATDKDGRGVFAYTFHSESTAGRIEDWSLKVSAPFSKTDNQATFASLSGLSGDVVLGGTYSSYTWDIDPVAYGDALCNACQEANLSLLDCFPENLPPEEAEATEDALFGTNTGGTWGGEFSVGRRERSFFELDSTKQKEDRTAFSGSVFKGWVFKRSSLYLKALGKRDYKENDKARLCSPVTGSVLETCNELPLGEAKTTEALVLSTEFRRFFQRLAIAPSAQYDIESDVWGVEVPIFAVRNENGGFTGGVKFSYRSDQDEPVAAIFITKALQP